MLSCIFDKKQIEEKLKDYTSEIIEYSYTNIVKIIIEKINASLYFSGYELIRISDTFIIRPISSNITVSTPNIKVIDREYVKNISNRAVQDISAGNYDSALTKSRTLLEEVFCYVIERKSEQPCKNGDIIKLYKQVKQLYNMHQKKIWIKGLTCCYQDLKKY